MVALIALLAIGLFAAGVIAGAIGLTSVAIRREEKNLTLTSEATDRVTQAGRLLNGVYVRDLRRARAKRLDHRQRHLLHQPFPDVASAAAPSPHRPGAHMTGRDRDAR